MVYVDELKRWGVQRAPTSHMTADSVKELVAFATRIGIPKSARHYGASTPHYDLTAVWREIALENGAIFMPAKEQARIRIARRSGDTT